MYWRNSVPLIFAPCLSLKPSVMMPKSACLPPTPSSVRPPFLSQHATYTIYIVLSYPNSFTTLSSLDLSHVPLLDSDVRFLVSLPALQVLFLESTGISNIGYASLSSSSRTQIRSASSNSSPSPILSILESRTTLALITTLLLPWLLLRR